MNSAVTSACLRLVGGSLGTTRRIRSRPRRSVDRPTDDSSDQRRDHAAGVVRSTVSPADLEHVRGAHERDAHQRGHPGRAASDGGRAEKPSPVASAIAEPCSGRDTEVRRRRLRSHASARADGEENRGRRIGARRHGKRSSRPAVSTTSPVMSARTAPGGKVLQG